MVPGEYITRHGFMDWRIYGEYGDVTINFPNLKIYYVNGYFLKEKER